MLTKLSFKFFYFPSLVINFFFCVCVFELDSHSNKNELLNQSLGLWHYDLILFKVPTVHLIFSPDQIHDIYVLLHNK